MSAGDHATGNCTGRARVAATPSGLGLADEWHATQQPPSSSRGAGAGGMQQRQQAFAQGVADELQAPQPSQRQQLASALGLADQWHATQQPKHSSRDGTESTFTRAMPAQHSMGQTAEEGPTQSGTADRAAAVMGSEGRQQHDDDQSLRRSQQALAEQRQEKLRQMADIEQRLQACLQQDFSGGAAGAEVRGVDMLSSGRRGAGVGDGRSTAWMWPVLLSRGAADGLEQGNKVYWHAQAGSGGLFKYCTLCERPHLSSGSGQRQHAMWHAP